MAWPFWWQLPWILSSFNDDIDDFTTWPFNDTNLCLGSLSVWVFFLTYYALWCHNIPTRCTPNGPLSSISKAYWIKTECLYHRASDERHPYWSTIIAYIEWRSSQPYILPINVTTSWSIKASPWRVHQMDLYRRLLKRSLEQDGMLVTSHTTNILIDHQL